MLAASLIVTGLLVLLRTARLRYVILALLVGLAAGRQFLWGTDFSRDWQTQKNLFWQMTWRAPGLQPNTMVLLNEGALDFYADNSLSAALNWIYAPQLDANGTVPYLLFYPTNRLDGALPVLQPDREVNYDYLAGNFQGSTSQVVSFYFLPPACLRVLDPAIDGDNHFIPDRYLMREGAALSSPVWIEPEDRADMPAIYGPEPVHGWCYYFEKADLARQMGKWQEVVELGEKAFALEDYPNDPAERFVFIEGYAHFGDWEKALNYSEDSHRVSPRFVDPMLCKLWSRIEAGTPGSLEKDKALKQIETKFACIP
jgi:tetratricopeptide (TPR) repeat protein